MLTTFYSGLYCIFYKVSQVPFIRNTTLGDILRDSRKIVLNVITSFHHLLGHQTLLQYTNFGTSSAATAATSENRRISWSVATLMAESTAEGLNRLHTPPNSDLYSYQQYFDNLLKLTFLFCCYSLIKLFFVLQFVISCSSTQTLYTEQPNAKHRDLLSWLLFSVCIYILKKISPTAQ